MMILEKIITFIFIFDQFFIGYFISNFFINDLQILCFTISFPLGTTVLSLFYYLISFIIDFPDSFLHNSLISVFFFAIFIIIYKSKHSKQSLLKKSYKILNNNSKKGQKSANNEMIFEFFVLLLISYFLVNKFYFPTENGCNYQIAPFISNEIAQINSFTQGINRKRNDPFKIYSTLCYNCTTNFNFLTAYNSALLFRCCNSLQLSLIIPTVFLMHASFKTALLFTKLLVFNSTSIAQYADKRKNYHHLLLLSYAAFFLMMNAGGLGFFSFLSYKSRFNPQTDYVSYISSETTTHWMHPIILYFLAHRCSQLAFPISIVCIYLIYLHSISFSNKPSHFNIFKYIGLLVSLLLVINYVCFFTIIVFIAFYFLSYYFKDIHLICIKRINKTNNNHEQSKYNHFPLKNIQSFLIIFLPFTLFLVFFIRPLTYTRSTRFPFVFFEICWKNLSNEFHLFNCFLYWFKNIGLFFVLSLFSFIGLDKIEKNFYYICTFIFIINNFIRFSYYYQDNTLSLFPFWCSFQSVFIVELLSKFVSKFGTNNSLKIHVNENPYDQTIVNNTYSDKNTIVYGIAFVAYILMVLSSITGTWYNINNITRLFDESDVIFSEFIKSYIPKNSVFLVPELSRNRIIIDIKEKWNYFHFSYYHLPPPLLSGQVALQMNSLSMYIHGYNWNLYSEQIKELKNNPNNITIFPNIEYILVDNDSEKNEYISYPEFNISVLQNSFAWTLLYSYKDLYLFQRNKKINDIIDF